MLIGDSQRRTAAIAIKLDRHANLDSLLTKCLSAKTLRTQAGSAVLSPADQATSTTENHPLIRTTVDRIFRRAPFDLYTYISFGHVVRILLLFRPMIEI
jgi:hypothetical protein